MSTFILLFLTSITFPKIINESITLINTEKNIGNTPNYQQYQNVSFILKSNRKGYQIKNADIKLLSSFGTLVEYNAYQTISNEYVVNLPFGTYPIMILVISTNDHEEYRDQIEIASKKKFSITLNYNNYHKEFSVNSSQLIEVFSTEIIKLNQNIQIGPGMNSNIGNEIEMQFALPMPKSWLGHDNDYTERISSIYYRSVREKLYYNLLKELVLQTTASKSAFATREIKNWIDSNSEKFGGSKIHKLSEHTHSLVEIFGETFQDKSELFSHAIETINFSYDLLMALEDGSLEAILLYLSFETFQEYNLQILKSLSVDSKLYKDIAFAEALSKVEQSIKTDMNKRLSELVGELRYKKANSLVLKTAITKIVTISFKKLSGFGTISSTLIISGVIDLISGVATRNRMEASLLLLAQIDRYLLKKYYENYYDAFDKSLKNDRDLYFGSLMRLHGGLIFNKIRKKYFEGKDQGVIVGLLTSASIDHFSKKMAEISSNKAPKAEYDYYRISLNCPENLSSKELFFTFNGEWKKECSGLGYLRIYPDLTCDLEVKCNQAYIKGRAEIIEKDINTLNIFFEKTIDLGRGGGMYKWKDFSKIIPICQISAKATKDKINLKWHGFLNIKTKKYEITRSDLSSGVYTNCHYEVLE